MLLWFQSCICQSDQVEFWVLLLDIETEHSRSLSTIHSFSNAFYSMSCLVVVLPSVWFSLYEFPQQEDFTRLESQSNAQPPTWRTRVPLLVWPLPFDLSTKGDPTSSYATSGIALQVTWVLKLPYHSKGEAPAGEIILSSTPRLSSWSLYVRFPIKTPYALLFCHMPHPCHSWFHHPSSTNHAASSSPVFTPPP